MKTEPERERPIEPTELEEDRTLLTSLRPSHLYEYIGQGKLVESLKIWLGAAQERREPLEHVLFYGPPGLGKTTLAHIIAAEMRSNIVSTSGPALERVGDLVGILTNLKEGDVLFIDEIHRLPRVVEEYLYSAMEDFRITFTIDRGPYAKVIPLNLNRFTLVGATTRAGHLTQSLRERFGIFHHVDFYSQEELEEIIRRSARILRVDLDDQAALEVASRSRGTPRIANRLLRRVRDYAQVKGQGTITSEVADEILTLQGVDKVGLDELDRKFLSTIIENYSGGPVGIEALSATLNEESDTLQDMVEPFLLKEGFVIRTPSGRKASPKAFQHLGYTPPAAIQEPLFDSNK
jgi:Holliday junction DNA helicase RuvB